MVDNVCPLCKKNNFDSIEAEEDTDADEILQSMICMDCGTCWTAIYRWVANVDMLESSVEG